MRRHTSGGLSQRCAHRQQKLTDPVRRELKKLIEDSALGISLGIVTHSEIDGNRMSWAVRTAFRRAMAPLSSKAGVFLVDGNGVPGLEYPCRFIVKGDSKSLSIAAASVVAKVTRDDMMLRAHTEYPKYGFNRHKGYGTREHIAAIESLGPCPIHRMSFEPLRTMFQTGQLTLFPGKPEALGEPPRAAQLNTTRGLDSPCCAGTGDVPRERSISF